MTDTAYKPTDEEAKVKKLFDTRFQAAELNRKPFDSKCDIIDKHYEPFDTVRKDWGDKPGQTMMRTGHIFHIMETLSANMVEPDPNWEITTQNPDDEESVKATRVALTDVMRRDGWPKKNMRLIRSGNRYGMAVAMIGYDYAERVDKEDVEQPHPNPLLRMIGKTKTITQENVTVLRDDPTVTLVDRRDFWWQPAALDIENCDWVLHRAYIPKSVLEEGEKAGHYKCISEVGLAVGGDDQPSNNTDERMKSRRREDADGVEVITMWDKVSGKRTKIAGRSVVISHEDIPYAHQDLPFAVYTPIPMEDRFEGLSPVEPLIPLQIETWTMENDRIRAVAMALNPTLLVDKTLKSGGEFHIKPGGRIFVSDVTQIQQLNINAEQALGFSEVQAYLGYMQQVSGVSPFIAGSDPGGYGINQDTATGVNQLAGAAGKRIGFHVQQAQDTMSRIGKQMIQLMNQYFDTERMIRVDGEHGSEWIQLHPEDIPMMFSLIVKGSTENLNAQAEKQQAIEFVREIAEMNNMPSPDGKQFTIVPAVNHLIEAFKLDPDKFWIGVTDKVQADQDAETQTAQASAAQAQGDAAMATPEMQMMMQQAQGQSDPNAQQGQPSPDDVQRRLVESMNFKDLPAAAQAAMLEANQLPSDGVMERDQLDSQSQVAKIQQMHSQAQSQSAGMDNA